VRVRAGDVKLAAAAGLVLGYRSATALAVGTVARYSACRDGYGNDRLWSTGARTQNPVWSRVAAWHAPGGSG